MYMHKWTLFCIYKPHDFVYVPTYHTILCVYQHIDMVLYTLKRIILYVYPPHMVMVLCVYQHLYSGTPSYKNT